MMKITIAAKQIFKITNNIKNIVASSTNTITKYLKLSEGEGCIEDVSHEFLFEKNLSEFDDFKVTNSFSNFGMIQKEGAIDWAAVRQLIYARFADAILGQGVEPIKSEAVIGMSEEFECLRAQGYDFKRVSNLIEQKKGVVVNEYEIEVRSNISNISDASLIERMKKLSISGYMSNYAGDDGLRQDIEDVMHKKAYVMQEFMMRVSELPACEVQFDQLKQVDILGDH